MGIEQLLTQKKSLILKTWFDAVVHTYPPDTAMFLKNQKDPFSNPVGSTVHKALDALLDGLLQTPMQTDGLAESLDSIMAIRAVQSFGAADAVSFIFALKSILTRVFSDEINELKAARDLAEFMLKIDQLGLLGFDLFMCRREKIYSLKVSEERRITYRALKRAGLVGDIPGCED